MTTTRRKPTMAQLRAEAPTIDAHRDGDVFTLTMSFPSPAWMEALTPHAKGGWILKAQATNSLRSEVSWQTSAWQYQGEAINPASITYRFFHPDLKRRDDANMVQRLKPVIDGLVDGGLIAGDHWQALKTRGIESSLDRENPRIEIEIRSIKENPA